SRKIDSAARPSLCRTRPLSSDAGERKYAAHREVTGMAAVQSMHQVRDVAVPMLREGRGEPVVFLHGAGGLPPWNAFFDKLAARYDVLVPEHPGFSTPDNAKAIRGVADLAMYYLDFLDGLDAGPVHLVGQSLGGWVAAELAVRNCSRVKSLSLLAPAGVRVKG